MMTDEQVKKGLAECTALRYQVGGCKQCPYKDDCVNGTQDQLYKDALALINRLEEEKEKLLYDLYCAEAKAQAKTAKEILSRVANITTEDHQPCRKYTWFKELAGKYGVEVEE